MHVLVALSNQLIEKEVDVTCSVGFITTISCSGVSLLQGWGCQPLTRK